MFGRQIRRFSSKLIKPIENLVEEENNQIKESEEIKLRGHLHS